MTHHSRITTTAMMMMNCIGAPPMVRTASRIPATAVNPASIGLAFTFRCCHFVALPSRRVCQREPYDLARISPRLRSISMHTVGAFAPQACFCPSANRRRFAKKRCLPRAHFPSGVSLPPGIRDDSSPFSDRHVSPTSRARSAAESERYRCPEFRPWWVW